MLHARGYLDQRISFSATVVDAAAFSFVSLRNTLLSCFAVSVHPRLPLAPTRRACLCSLTNTAVLGPFALQLQQKGSFSQATAVKHFWQQATAPAAVADAVASGRGLRQQRRQPQKQQQGTGKRKKGKACVSSAGGPGAETTITAAAATAAAAANVVADPRALDGVYSSSFYLSFVAAAAAHAAPPVAVAAAEAGAATAGHTRLRGANQKRHVAIERLLRLQPQMLPSVARVAATAARMQPQGRTTPPASPPASAQTLWREELAIVLRTTPAAAAAAADRAFWNAFAVAAADAAQALAPADIASIAVSAAAAAGAGAPGWKALTERHQRMLLELREQIRMHAEGFSLPQLLSSIEALQSLQRIPSAALPAATVAVSAAATAREAATAALAAVAGESGGKNKAAAIAAAAAVAGDVPLLLQCIEGTLHTKLAQAAQRATVAAPVVAEPPVCAATAAASAVIIQPSAAGKTRRATAAAREDQQPAFCRLVLRCLRLFAAAEVPCPALLQRTSAILASRCAWFSTGQLVELAELLLQLQPQDRHPTSTDALHALNSRFITDTAASEVSLQQLLRLIRAYGGMGLTSPSLLAAALSYFKAADDIGSPSQEVPGLCSVSPQRAQAAALRAVGVPATADGIQEQQTQQQHKRELVLPCRTAYMQCLADAETAAALGSAAAFPDGASSKDQTAMVLLHCLLQQQALGRSELLQLLPTLLQELQHQQKQQEYLQCCGLVLSVCASCGVHFLQLWEELLSPLLQPFAGVRPAAAAQAAAAGAPWGGWLLCRPLAQHLEAALSAALFCDVACVGAETSGEKNELLSAAASAAAHTATIAGGFLSFLHRSCSIGCLRQLSGESLAEMVVNICGLYRVQSAAAVVLRLLPRQQSPRQQGQHKQQRQPAKGCPGASPVDPAESSPGIRELLVAAFPEWHEHQQKLEEKHLQEARLQRELQQQQRLLLEQQSGLVFELLLELAFRGSPKCAEGIRSSQLVPRTVLLLLDGSKGEANLEAGYRSIHPATLSFLQSAARGAADLHKSSDSSGSINAGCGKIGPLNSNIALNACSGIAAATLPTPCSSINSRSTFGCPVDVDLLLLLPQVLHEGRRNSTVFQQLLQLLVLVPAAETSAELSAAANRYMQHLERLVLTARLQQRHKGTKPRTPSPNSGACPPPVNC